MSPLTESLMGRFVEEDNDIEAKELRPLVSVATRAGRTQTTALIGDRTRGDPGQKLPSWLDTLGRPMGQRLSFTT